MRRPGRITLVVSLLVLSIGLLAADPITLGVSAPEVYGFQVSINGFVGSAAGSITRISWDWGDGSVYDSWFPATHAYINAGTYLVTTTAYDSAGNTRSVGQNVTVGPGGTLTADPITLSLSAQDVSLLDVWINGFVASTAGTITRISWDWGDGIVYDRFFPATHTYAASGVYPVTTTAYDSVGNLESSRQELSVGPPALSASQALVSGLQVSFNGSAGSPEETITRISWDWGDGSTSESFFPATHTYVKGGTYRVVATAFEGADNSSSFARMVTAIAPSGPLVGVAGSPFEYAAGGSAQNLLVEPLGPGIPSERFLFASQTSDPSLSVLAVQPSGALSFVGRFATAPIGANAVGLAMGVGTGTDGSLYVTTDGGPVNVHDFTTLFGGRLQQVQSLPLGTANRARNGIVHVDRPDGQYVFVNNNPFDPATNAPLPNYITSFRVDTSAGPGSGTLSTLATTITGGLGDRGLFAAPRLISGSPDGTRLYCLNQGSFDITVFQIGAGGALTWVEAYPLNAAPSGSLAVDPTDTALYAGTIFGDIVKFDIGAGGELTHAGIFSAGASAAINGMVVTPDGSDLIAVLGPPVSAIAVVDLATLVPRPGSPIPDFAATDLALDARGDRLWVGHALAGGVISAYTVDTDSDGTSNGSDNCTAVANPGQEDTDGDGVGDACDECVDHAGSSSSEVCNGLDDDCDGALPAEEADADGDGVLACNGDCNDFDADMYPGNPEVCGDGIDQNCNGFGDDANADGDGFMNCGGDCDDSNPSVHPGATEVCNAVDDDCDGSADEGLAAACYSGPAGTENVGACHGGTSICSGGVYSACLGEVLPAADDASCNGIDDDCDGAADDDYASIVTSCGVGACFRDGATACVGGSVVDQCVPGVPAPDDSGCDGIDDDCDGLPDDEGAAGALSGGLVSWWRGEGTAGDEVGGHPGSSLGAVSFESAHAGLGFKFDADGEGVTIPHDAALNGDPSGFSVSFWMRGVHNQPHPLYLVVDKSHGFTDFTGWLFQGESGSGDLVFGFGTGSGFPAVGAGMDLLDGVLHHVVGTWDGSSMRIYVDGVLRGSLASAPPVGNSRSLNIGYAWGGGAPQRWFRGQVDELLFYNRTLSLAEVEALRSGSSTGLCADDDSDGYAAFQDCDDSNPSVNPGATEACNGGDDDCDGAVDEGNPGGGAMCGTDVGECQTGVTLCSGGTLTCDGDIEPTPEVCDTLDNDCDGSVDDGNPGGGGPCGSTDVGECAFGVFVCVDGAMSCQGSIEAAPEVCDNRDNDCDGSTDNGDPGGGLICGSDVGECQAGVTHCVGGGIACAGSVGPVGEVCDGLDNDCDGSADDGDPGGGVPCGSTDAGECALGVTHCVTGALACVGSIEPTFDLCDGLDNDCDGTADDEAPGSPSDLAPLVSPVSVTLATGGQTSRVLSFTNAGSQAVRITDAAFAAGFSTPSVAIQPFAPFTVCPGGSAAVTALVDATGALDGDYSGTVRLTNAAVTGEAIAGLAIHVSPPGLPDLTPSSGAGAAILIDGTSGAPPLGATEDFTIQVQVSNIGLGAAGAFGVTFYDGTDPLGTVSVPSGLAAGASTPVSLGVVQSGGSPLLEGFHLIRVVVSSPAGGEVSITNNGAATVVQIGNLGVTGAVIDVSATASTNCSGSFWYVGGRADYFLVTPTADLVSFPVQGGLVTVSIYDATGTTLVATFAETHTLTTGEFQVQGIAPSPGSYLLRVEVTDFSVDPPGLEEIVSPQVPSCPPPAGTPPPDPTPYTDLSICSTDIAFLAPDCTTPFAGDPGPGDTVCLRATIHNSGPSGTPEQLARFRVQVPGGSSIELEPRVPFSFIGPGAVEITKLWTPADDGLSNAAPVVTVDIVTNNISQNTVDDLATRALRIGAASPLTEIRVDVESAGCYPSASGHAVYTDPDGLPMGPPVSCGTVTLRILDALNPSVVVRSASGYRCAIDGWFYAITDYVLPGAYIAEVEVTDGTLTGTGQRPFECLAPSAPDPYAPPPPSPTTPPPADLFLFAEDVAFLGDGTCSTGLFENPGPNEEIGVYATIHYNGADPLVDQPVEVTEYLPVGNSLVPVPIGSTTVDFPSGAGLAPICLPWTPTTIGTRIVQVQVDPTIGQFTGNDAATRAFTVGKALCGLTLSATRIDFPPGGTAQLAVTAFDETGLTTSLDLRVVGLPSSGLPDGFAFTFDPLSPLSVPGSTTLTVSTIGAPEAGRHSIFVVGTSDICNAAAVFTLNVQACTDRDGDGFGFPGSAYCPGGAAVDCDDDDPARHPGQAEVCNGFDDDCDGAADDGDPGGGQQCGTTDVGECSFGVTHCVGGALDCVGDVAPAAEACDYRDNDCDGVLDNGAPCGHAQIVKLTGGQIIGPSVMEWSFTLTGPSVGATDTQDSNGLVDFSGVNLIPGAIYTLCETNIPAGWTTFWWFDTDSDRLWDSGETVVTPYNPNQADVPPQDLGNRCYDFSLASAATLNLTIDNRFPGGDPRTIGFWKNWNTCTGGNQIVTATKNGGPSAGWYLLDNLLPQTIGLYQIVSCSQGVKILSKQDKQGQNKASDAAYELASQFLAARLNLAAGARSCQAVQQAVTDAQDLLELIKFTGDGTYLPSKGSKASVRSRALALAATLDAYNNGRLCF